MPCGPDFRPVSAASTLLERDKWGSTRSKPSRNPCVHLLPHAYTCVHVWHTCVMRWQHQGTMLCPDPGAPVASGAGAAAPGRPGRQTPCAPGGGLSAGTQRPFPGSSGFWVVQGQLLRLGVCPVLWLEPGTLPAAPPGTSCSPTWSLAASGGFGGQTLSECAGGREGGHFRGTDLWAWQGPFQPAPSAQEPPCPAPGTQGRVDA